MKIYFILTIIFVSNLFADEFVNIVEIINNLDLFYFTLFATLIIIFLGALISIVQTLTSFKKKYEEKNIKLKESKDLLSGLLNVTMEAVVLFDSKFKVIYINNSAKIIFQMENYNENELDISHISNKYIINKIKDHLKSSEKKPMEVTLQKINKEKFPALLLANSIIQNGEKCTICSIIDLSELKEKEKLSINNAKLAQMGGLITMIAHQWKQPLQAIINTNDAILLKQELETLDKSGLTYLCNDIKKYVRHLDSTIDDFRNFYKEDKELTVHPILEIIKDALKIVKAPIESSNITINISKSSTTKLTVYENEFKQALLCIINNAIDALKINNVTNPNIEILIENNDENKTTSIKIRDNAGGIPEDIINKIFEPYFSTKLEKNGTGIGLHMAKTIIERVQGKINAMNTDGGAEFELLMKNEL